MLTSFKGGVGKSTVTANLALSLALEGKRVLAVDCDFNMRCLDLIMGLEDHVVYDVCDVITQRVPAQKAILCHERSQNLMILAAPYSYQDEITPADFGKTVKELITEYELDYVLLDTPGDKGIPHALACAASDMAIILSTHQPASIRAAERTAEELQNHGVRERRLIINNFDFDAVRRGKLPGVSEIIDRTTVQLIGAIPFDPAFSRLQESGQLIDPRDPTPACEAITNIAKRIINPIRNIPLFDGFSRTERRVARI